MMPGFFIVFLLMVMLSDYLTGQKEAGAKQPWLISYSLTFLVPKIGPIECHKICSKKVITNKDGKKYNVGCQGLGFRWCKIMFS